MVYTIKEPPTVKRPAPPPAPPEPRDYVHFTAEDDLVCVQLRTGTMRDQDGIKVHGEVIMTKGQAKALARRILRECKDA